MSRVFAWDDEPYPNAAFLFQRSVENSINGKRGQALLREIEEALLMLPDKKLLASTVCEDGKVCALGAVAILRAIKNGQTYGIAAVELEYAAVNHGQGNYEKEDKMFKFLKGLLDIKHSLAWQLVFENDEGNHPSPEMRYHRMLKWVQERIVR